MHKSKKNTAPDEANIRSGKAGTNHKNAETHPCSQYSTALPCKQVILPILRCGAENAVSTEDLQRITGMDSRSIRAQVAAEREDGALILSGQRGYFLPSPGEKGREEMVRFVQTIQSKGISTLKAAVPTLQALRVLNGQVSIKEWGDGKKEKRAKL